MTATSPLSLSDRFGYLMKVAGETVAASIAHGVQVAMILLIYPRLNRLAVRFAAAILLPDAPARASGPGRIRPASAARAAGVLRLPGRFGWLARLVPHVSAYHTQVQNLLADPEMVALFGKPRVGRVLRALCRMFAAEIPPALQLPPRPRKPRPGKPGKPGKPDAGTRARPAPSRPGQGRDAPHPHPHPRTRTRTRTRTIRTAARHATFGLTWRRAERPRRATTTRDWRNPPSTPSPGRRFFAPDSPRRPRTS